MVATPWGEATELRERRLTPGPGTDPEEVRRNQRQRLMAATVAVVAERGYEATRVADLLELAGVSRNAFYGMFASKQDCFLTTIDAIAGMTGRVVREAYERTGGSWDERLRVAFATVADLVVAQPAASQIGLVEIYAAGPEAVERLDRIEETVEQAVSRALRESPKQAGMPREIVRSVLGGLRKIVYTRVREERVDELPALAPAMLDWAMSYETPSARLRRPRKVPEQFTARRRAPVDARERIFEAITELVAEKGYQAMTITEIAERAAASLTTFYDNFEGKEDAFLATFAVMQQEVFDATLPVFAAGGDWAQSVSAAARAFSGFLATHPAVAQLGGVEAWATSPAGLDLRAQSLALFEALLDEGFRQYPGSSPAAAEGISASLDALLFKWVNDEGSARLYEIAPTASFVALAPFVGSERALELANEEPAPSAS